MSPEEEYTRNYYRRIQKVLLYGCIIPPLLVIAICLFYIL